MIYEVDDPQENYEDIEAKIIQTEAEVHNSPQATPESDAAPPPGLAQGDEDYLVPGQDGWAKTGFSWQNRSPQNLAPIYSDKNVPKISKLQTDQQYYCRGIFRWSRNLLQYLT